MRAYVVTTSTIFGLLTLVHIWRAIVEGVHLGTDPWYILITLASAALCVWGLRLLRRSSRP